MEAELSRRQQVYRTCLYPQDLAAKLGQSDDEFVAFLEGVVSLPVFGNGRVVKLLRGLFVDDSREIGMIHSRVALCRSDGKKKTASGQLLNNLPISEL